MKKINKICLLLLALCVTLGLGKSNVVYAAEYTYNAYKATQTVGVLEEDPVYGIRKIAEPIGLSAVM